MKILQGADQVILYPYIALRYVDQRNFCWFRTDPGYN